MRFHKPLSLLPLLAALAVPGLASAQHLDNPFVGATMYVNPNYTAEANAEAAAQSNSTLAANMRTVGQQPTAVWMDQISAISTLSTHLDNALAQGANLFFGVIYDMPGRDCAALASNGELPLTAAGLASYKSNYIDAIYAIASQSKYANLRMVWVVEPDSLPNLVTNLSISACANANSSGIYVQAVQYAVNKMHSLSNQYLYIDIGHSGWLGWPNNASGFITTMNTVSSGFTAGKNAIEGFVDDTANTLPLKEPFFTGAMTVGGQQVMSATFYSYDPDVDEQSYSADMYSRFTAAGWPSSIGILLDTSRNGWGGSARPTAASTSTDVNTFVNASKVDRRAHRGLWCNPTGAGIGERPQAAPSGWSSQHYDAFIWVKPPGESDGSSTLIVNDQGKGFDRMCDPTYMTQYGVLTGALANAPLAGQFFPAQFDQLVANAYPPFGGATQCYGVPNSPSGLVASNQTGSSVVLNWTGASAPAGCSVTYSVYAGTTNNFTPSASTLKVSSLPSTTTTYTVTGLTPNTTYFFLVQAVDSVGAAGSNYYQTNTTNGYTLTVAKTGTGGTVSGGGINCGTQCSVVTNPGVTVTLTATPDSGGSFNGWSGDCTGTSLTCAVNMSQSRSVSASFSGGSGTSYALTVTKTGTGSGTVTSSSGAINCGSTCSANITANTVVTLSAAAASGSTFGGWSVSSCGTAATCAVTMSSAQTVSAAFNGPQSYTLTVAKSGTGTVTSSTGGISCGSTCSATYTSGTTVTLTAAAGSGFTFQGYSGACTGTTCVLTMTANQTVTATFQGSVGSTPVAQHGRLKVCGTHICDASGAQVQFKGMSWFWSNTGWGAERFFNAQAVQNLYSTWGASIIRAPLGVEGGGGYVVSTSTNPADPSGNLARITTLIDAAISTGVYVIVDWHYSSNTYYQSQAQAFFQQLATKYASAPNIIWEPYNEPTSNDWPTLKAYHQAIISTIRAAGSQNLVVAGTPTWSQDVDTASQSPISDSNTAYTMHFYAGTHGSTQINKANTAMANGVAILVTEWGTVAASGTGGFNSSESTVFTQWMDQNKISSCNWSLNDKAEDASAFVSGGTVSATGPWSASDLTQSGTWIKAYIGANQPQTFTLTVAKAGTGSGTVTSSSGGISCGSTCSASYSSGTLVTLTAAATSPSTFGGWSGACSGTNTTCSVTMSQAQTVTATFNGTTTSTLTVAKSGTGSGTVTSSSGGISCGSTCSASYTSGTVVTLTAAAASGSQFTSWSGCSSSSGTTCVVTVSSSQTVTATFGLVVTNPTLSVSVSGPGTVTSSSGNISCTSNCSATYNSGTMVTLTAAASSGASFSGWGGACSGTASTCTLTMNASLSVTATFTTVTTNPTLTVAKSGTGSGTVTSSSGGISCGSTCAATYTAGTVVTLTAAPTSPSTFGGWSITSCGTSTTCVVTVSASQTVTATFNGGTTSGCTSANAITFSWNSGNFNTTAAVCYRANQTINGWGCSNMDGRTVAINGTTVSTCGGGALAHSSDGYTYFSATAGTYPWASFYVY